MLGAFIAKLIPGEIYAPQRDADRDAFGDILGTLNTDIIAI